MARAKIPADHNFLPLIRTIHSATIMKGARLTSVTLEEIRFLATEQLRLGVEFTSDQVFSLINGRRGTSPQEE